MNGLGFGTTRNGRHSTGDGREYVNVCIFGSSNMGSMHDDSSIFTDQYDNFEAGRVFKVNHSDALVAYTTPINQNGVSSYNYVNEDMGYGVAEAIAKTLLDNTTKKIGMVSSYESSIPVGYVTSGNGQGWFKSRNASDPSDTSTRYGQVVTRALKLIELTGEPIDLIYFPDAGKECSYGAHVGSAVVVAAYETGIPLFLSDIGCPDAVCVVPNVGVTPVGAASGYPNWNNVKTGMRNDFTPPANTYLIDPENDLSININDHIQHEYDLAVGESGTWTIGETLDDASGNSGKVSSYNLGGDVVWTEDNAGFADGDVITGATSAVTATLDNPVSYKDVHYNTAALNLLGAAAANKYLGL